MRTRVLLAALLLGAGVAQAQVVSPLGGSTSNPQSPPPATRAAPPRSTMTAPPNTAPAATPAPATTAAPATTPAPATAAAPSRTRRSMSDRFAAANTTHDGKLTLEQARAGRLRSVVRDFDQIDTTKRGYVTLDEVKAHQAARRRASAAARAAKPAAPQ